MGVLTFAHYCLIVEGFLFRLPHRYSLIYISYYHYCKMKLLLALLVFVSIAVYSDALCCPWKVTPDVKCACDDGGLVHPWDCYSVGSCNVFCCNCGGPCRNNETSLGKEDFAIFEEQRSKRSVTTIDHEEYNMALHFNAVDNDNNGVIDVNEAFDHFARDKVMKFVHRFVTPVWFSKVDSDHNGIISPSEFDAQLSSEILEKFDLSNVL